MAPSLQFIFQMEFALVKAKGHNVCKAPSTPPPLQFICCDQLVVIQASGADGLLLAIHLLPGFARLVSSCGMMIVLQRTCHRGLLYFRSMRPAHLVTKTIIERLLST